MTVHAAAFVFVEGGRIGLRDLLTLWADDPNAARGGAGTRNVGAEHSRTAQCVAIHC